MAVGALMVWGLVDSVQILSSVDYLYENSTDTINQGCNDTKWFIDEKQDKQFYGYNMGLAIMFAAYVLMVWVFLTSLNLFKK